ncbi:MAG TPA: hypothetical protein VGE38_07195 [Nocardioides sp.]|uniref:hypothetical protein n=1 Tax=Nocardioides sp. TaxID=35761 RepID=UPI002EDA4BA9
MEISWWAVDFKTGVRISQVNVKSSGKLARIIGLPTDTTVSVRCSHDGVVVPGWDEATTPGRMMLVAVDADGDQIIWGGLVRRRTSDVNDAWVDCSADTLERYLQRRYINTPLTWNDVDPTQVAVDVLGQVTGLAPLVVDAKMVGHPIVRGFYDITDNKRVGDVLDDLAGLSTGIEWTVDLEWTDAAHTQMRYVVRISPRLGTPGGVAATQWTMPGCVTGGTFIEDFGTETGANDIIALSSGEGESKPRSTRYEDTLLLASYARFERRFTPATSITSTSTLDQYAEAELAATRLGLSQLTITANLDAAPQVNRDWWLGDDIDVHITSPRFPRQVGTDGFWVPGYSRRLRTVGWELDLDARTIVPRIKEAA